MADEPSIARSDDPGDRTHGPTGIGGDGPTWEAEAPDGAADVDPRPSGLRGSAMAMPTTTTKEAIASVRASRRLISPSCTRRR